MALYPAMRCHRIHSETEIHQLEQINRCDPRLHQMVKNLIIFGNRSHYPAFVRSPNLDLRIVIPVPATVTTELLIRSSVLDLMSALQTDGNTSGNLVINHTPEFLDGKFEPARTQKQ